MKSVSTSAATAARFVHRLPCVAAVLLSGVLASTSAAHAQTTVGGDGPNETDSTDYSGDQSLEKVGTNMVSLTGSSTYTLGTTITAGTLSIGAGGTVGSITGSVALGDGSTLVFNRSDDVTFGGVISGTAGFIQKLGSGTLTLTGPSTWNGGLVTVREGTLQVAAIGFATTDASRNYVVEQGATLQIGYSNTFGSGVRTDAISVYGNGVSATTGLAFQGGTLFNMSSGVQLLGAPTTIRAYGSGTAGLGSAGIFPNEVFFVSADASGSVIDSAVQFVARGYGASVNTAAGTSTATGDLIVNSPLNVVGTGAYVAAWLQKYGEGSLRLNVAATGSNQGVRIAAGTIIAGTASVIGENALLEVQTNATLKMNGFDQAGMVLQGGGQIVNDSATPVTLSIDQTKLYDPWDASTTFSGVLGGTTAEQRNFSFVKTGTGTLTLSGNNNYTGTTSISGPLQVGAGGTTGSLGSGAVTNDGSLIINRSNVYTLANAITGTGSLTQAGTGQTILSGSNDYAGTTTVNAGILQFATTNSLYGGDTAQWTQENVTVNAGATLAVNVGGSGEFAAGDVTLLLGNLGATGGAVNGNGFQAGSFVGFDTTNAPGGSFTLADTIADSTGTGGGAIGLAKLGSGTLALTAANTYSGNSTIYAGTLAVGTGGTTGSIQGNVDNRGTLLFNRSDDITFAGIVSGTGSLTQQGTAMVTLTGANTYSGATTIASGTLRVGNGGTSGALGTGAITNAGTLVFNRSDAITLAAVIGGTGAVIKDGVGTLTLTANSPSVGPITVAEGTLAIAGGGRTNTAGTILVQDGGRLLLSRTDIWGNAGTTATPVVTIETGGVVESNGTYNTLISPVLAGGTLRTNGGVSAGYPAFGIKGTVSVNATTGGSRIASSGSGSFNSIAIVDATTFDVADGAAADDLTVSTGIVGLGGGAANLVKVGAGTMVVTGSASYSGRTTVREGTLRLDAPGSINNGLLLVGDTAASAVFRVNGGSANVQGTSQIGMGAGTGSVVVDSGNLTVTGELWLGTSNTADSFGALTINGGTVTTTSWLALGRGVASGTSSSRGFIQVNDGTLNVTNGNLVIGAVALDRNATSVMAVSGGAVNATNNIWVGEHLSGILDVSGGSVTTGAADRVWVKLTGAGTGIVNLRGGTVATGGVGAGTGGTSIVNFDGGTLAASQNTASFLQGLTAAYVHDGGATIDTNGFGDVTIGQPLLAPTGDGVSTIAFTGGSGYVTAPIVDISGGGGTGATALAEIDAAGNLVGITVTNPGVGYTGAPTVTLVGGGGSGAAIGGIGLAANTSGGLTKAGAGVLKITGANIYSGGTRITSGTLQVGNGGATGQLGTGAITNDGALVFFRSGTVAVADPISGSGSVRQSGGGIVILSGTNTYAGMTTIASGTIQFATEASLYGGDTAQWTKENVTVNPNTTLALNVGGSGEFTTGNVSTLLANLGATGGAVNGNGFQGGSTIAFDSTNATAPFTVAANMANSTGTGGGAIGITKTGAGTVVLSGSNTAKGLVRVAAGVLDVTGSLDNDIGSTSGGATSITQVATGTAPAQLRVSGGYTTHELQVGNAANAVAAVVQTGGSMNVTKPASPYGFRIAAAANSYGYYGLTSGTLSANQADVGGIGGAGGTAILEVSGGVADINGWVTMSHDGGSQQSLLNVIGTGTLIARGGNGLQAWFGGTKVVNVRDSGLLRSSVDAASTFASGTGIVNIGNGGVFESRGGIAGGPGLSLLNFDGGTLRALGDTALIADNLTGVYVYGGGAVLDTNGFTNTLPARLLNPTGEGVASVAITSGGSGYIAPPLVTISGGGGTGATGYATVVDGVVTGIVITNPGSGYTSAPTVALSGGGGTGATLGTAATATNVGGGLTKTGDGTLLVTAANEYTGPTVVAGGTLAFAGGGWTLASSPITVQSGATLRFDRNDTWGPDYTSATPVITIDAGGTVRSNDRFNTLISPVFNGGTLLTDGGVNAAFPAFGLKGTVTVNATGGGSQIESTGQGSHNTVAIGTGAAGGTTTFDVADGVAAADLTVAVPLSNLAGGAAGLVKQGAGTMLLTAANTYTHDTTISAGTLRIGGAGSLGDGAYAAAIANDGVLAWESSANQVLSGVISGSGALTKAGAGVLTLTGSSTFTGPTTIAAGEVVTRTASALGNGGAATLSGGVLTLESRLDVGSFSWDSAAVLGIENATAGAFLNSAGLLTLTGAAPNMFDLRGSFIGSSRTKLMTATNMGSYTTSNFGVFQQLPGDYALTIDGDSLYITENVLVVNGLETASGTNAYSGIRFVAGSDPVLEVPGGAAITINSTATIDNGGAITLTGGAFTATGPITVSAGSTLGGAGTVTGEVTTSGIIAPTGSAPLIVDGNLGFTSSGAWAWELFANSASNPGTDFTAPLAVGGDLTVASGATFGMDFGPAVAFQNPFWTTNREWTVATGTGSLASGTNFTLAWVEGSSITNPAYLSLFSLGVSGTTLTLNYAAPGYTYINVATGTTLEPYSGPTGLIMEGPGTATLAGTNTYIMGTVVNAGTLIAPESTSLPEGGDVTVNGGTLDLQGTGTTSVYSYLQAGGTTAIAGGGTVVAESFTMTGGTLTGSGTFWSADYHFEPSGTATVGAVLGNLGTVPGYQSTATITGTAGTAGTVVFTSAMTYSGTTTITNATLQLGDGTAAGSVAGDIVNEGTLAFGQSGEATFANTVTGGGVIRQVGTGTTTLGLGTADFAGTFGAANGTLRITDTTSLGAAMGIGLASNGTFEVAAAGGLTVVPQDVAVTSGTGIVRNSGAGTLRLDGDVTNAGTLVLAGGTFDVAGTITGSTAMALVIDGARAELSAPLNDYAGETRVRGGGTLVNGFTDAVSTQSAVVLGAAGETSAVTNTWDLAGHDQAVASLASAGSGVNAVVNSGTAGNVILVIDGAASTTYAGTIDGAIALVRDGSGTLTLSASNSYAGSTTLRSGGIVVQNPSAFGSGATSLDGGTLTLQSRLDTDEVSWDGAATIAIADPKGGQYVNVAGPLSITGGTNTFGLAGVTLDAEPTRLLTAANVSKQTFSAASFGATGVSDYRIWIGGSTVWINEANLAVSGTTTTTGQREYTTATFAPGSTLAVAPGGDLFIETIEVDNSSVLLVGGTLASDNVVFVSAGSTLTGDGTVRGDVSVAGTVTPNGTLTVDGDVTWLPGGDFNWKISDAEGEPGVGWSVLELTGGLDLTGLSAGNPFAINLWSLASLAPETDGAAANFDPTTNYEWTILTAAGGITGFDPGLFTVNPLATNGTGGFVNGLDGGWFSVLQEGESLKLVFTAVPEPATVALAVIGLATAACLRVRCRRSRSSATVE